MSLKHNPFQPKLQELEQEYGKLQSRIWMCHKGTGEELAGMKKTLFYECMEDERSLEEIILSGRSKAVSEMAEEQLEHYRKTRETLNGAILHLSGSQDQSEAETAALYAEFAMDYAMHAARCALLAVCAATEMQMEIEETEENEIQEERE